MKIQSTGTLSGITGAVWGSGVSSTPIALNMRRDMTDLYAWISIEGDLGRTGGSVCVFIKGCYSKGGVTYASENNVFLVKSGTSVSGPHSNGSYLAKFQCVMPYIKIEALASKSGSTQHGSGTTTNCSVKYAICAL